MGGSAHPYPPGWGCAQDPAFLQWHGVPNGLKTQYKKTPLNKTVLECSIYPLETIKIRFGNGLDFTSKIG